MDDWITKADAYETPISESVLRLVDLRLEHVRKTRGGVANEPPGQNPRGSCLTALLAGHLVCGRCGRNYGTRPYCWKVKDPLTGEVTRRRSYSYACGGFFDGGPEACPQFRIHREDVEDPIINRVRENLLRSTTEEGWKAEIRGVLKEIYNAGVDVGRREGLIKRRAEANHKARAILTGISEANKQFIDDELTRVRQEIKAIDDELTRLTGAGISGSDLEGAVEELWGLLANFEKNFDAADPTEKRRILAPFVKRLTAYPERGEVEVELYTVPLGVGDYRGRLVPPRGFEPRSQD
ncbi:MAG: recombinase zinc beta ribbon domain-containing protein [Planctomycetes bacterium]|nr:recombinase zinc beta ribbon domain-containing protein [Planctomycetota bacterium]